MFHSYKHQRVNIRYVYVGTNQHGEIPQVVCVWVNQCQEESKPWHGLTDTTIMWNWANIIYLNGV